MGVELGERKKNFILTHTDQSGTYGAHVCPCAAHSDWLEEVDVFALNGKKYETDPVMKKIEKCAENQAFINDFRRVFLNRVYSRNQVRDW